MSSSPSRFRTFGAIAALAACSLWCGPAHAQEPPFERHREDQAQTDVRALIDTAARRFQLPPLWIEAVMRVESAGRTHAVSHKGAIGLMQVMPATYAGLRDRYDLGADPFAPHDNVMAGAAYLREMYDRFAAPGLFAAYNAGPDRYEDYLQRGRRLPPETIDYLARLERLIGPSVDWRSINRAPSVLSTAAASPLFPPLSRAAEAAFNANDGATAEASDAPPPPRHPLFAPLHGAGPRS